MDDLDIEEMDINWQIAMIVIQMKKFYKKTGRRVRNVPQRGTHEESKEDSFKQPSEAGSQEKNQMGLLTMDDGIVNWGEHTEVEETNHALMAISPPSPPPKIKMKGLGDQEAQILAYSQAVKKLEAQLGPQKPEISNSDDNSTEHSTCQSNDSEGSCGNTFEHSSESESESISVPNEISMSKQQMKNQETSEVKGKNWNKMMEIELGEGDSFIKKKCFVCGSLSHLIKDCDYYEKKMAREAEFKKQRVFNTVQLNDGRPNINSIRPNINTGRTNINSVRLRVNTGNSNVNNVRSKQPVPTRTSNSFSPKRPQVNQFIQRRHFTKSYSPVRRPIDRNTAKMSNFNVVKGNWGTAVKTSAGHMTGNKDHLDDFEEYKGGSVTFGELGHFNLFSILQICDKQHKVLFTETECLVVSPDFKMPDENQILLKVPRQHNMYSFDMKTPAPTKDYACLIAKATSDESKLWHRRLGHINFKNLNKLVKGNLVRGLPSKVFRNDHTCVACQKGKQHKASCKAKLERTITEPLHTLHMDLFGPTFVKSINHASYCLVITDDCTRFSWVFFLATKDETSGILQNFIRQIENQLNHRVKIIRSDNGTEFNNRDMLEFCGNNGIKQEYSNARTPQQNKVAERMNRTLIEAARTMLAGSLLPTTFWAEAVSTACYIFNRLLEANWMKLAPKHYEVTSRNKATSTTSVNSGSGLVNTQHANQDDSDMPELTIFNKPQKGIFDEASYDVEGDAKSSVQTKSRVHQHSGAHALEEPKKIFEALKDNNWVEAMQEELLQFKLQQVWVLVDLSHGAKVIGTKWVYKNKRNERGVVVRNKARLVA
ncbi:putative ribonuclease H-like domain-containing protein [Tanacetum coccineum]